MADFVMTTPNIFKVGDKRINLCQLQWIEVKKHPDKLQVKLLFVDRFLDLYDEEGKQLLEYLDMLDRLPA